MGDGALWRIPERKKVEAVFFDVDGTLTDAQGRIPDRTVSVLEYMAKRLPLYLSTALPVSHAKKPVSYTHLTLPTSELGTEVCYATGKLPNVFRLQIL